MSIKSQAISGVKWTTVSAGAVSFLQFITLAALARILSPSDFGLMGMVMVVIGFARLFADMGISNAIIYKQDAAREQLSSLYWLNIFSGILIFIIVIAISPLIVAFYHESRLYKLLILSSLVFLITPFGQQFQILMQKDLLFNRLAKIEIFSSFMNAFTAVFLAFFYKIGVYAIIWGQIISSVSRVALLLFWGFHHNKPHFHFSKKDLKGFIGFGLYQMGEKTINYFNSNFDSLLIGSLLGANALGYYNLANSLVLKPIGMINPIITRVAFPIFSKVQNDMKKLKNGYLKVIQLLSLLNIPLMIGLAVTAPVAVQVILGKQWAPSIILVQILAFVGLLRSISNPIGSLILAKGRADIGFKWNLALLITQIIGLYLGARFGGTTGVALAYALLMSSYLVFEYLLIIRKLIGRCIFEYLSNIFPFVWKAFIMGCMVLIIGKFLQAIPEIFILTIQTISGMIIYSSLIIFKHKDLVIEIKEMIWIRKTQ